jgi:uncharacterized membrane protein
MADTQSSIPESESFFADIIKPGSSLNPTFLLILDGAFSFLFFVLLSLAFLTSGNPHIFALMGIEIALWGSVKWYVQLHAFSWVSYWWVDWEWYCYTIALQQVRE